MAVTDGPDAAYVSIGLRLQSFLLFDERKARGVDASVHDYILGECSGRDGCIDAPLDPL